MSHILQALAQHWHLSASQYWQLRLLCAITLGPLVGTICLVLFNKRDEAGSQALRIKRRVRGLALPGGRLPLHSMGSRS